MWDYGVIGSPHSAAELRRCQLHVSVFWVVSLAQLKKAWLHDTERVRTKKVQIRRSHRMNARHACPQLEAIDPFGKGGNLFWTRKPRPNIIHT